MGIVDKASKTRKVTANDRASNHETSMANPFLKRPSKPEEAIKLFLVQSRSIARRQAVSGNGTAAIEIEARLGTLVSPFGAHDMRVLSSGPKLVPIQGKERVAHAFVCNIADNAQQGQSKSQGGTNFEGGITRSNYLKWTQAGLSEASPISAAFSCKRPQPHESESLVIKSQLVESESVTSVFAYPNKTRVNFPHVNVKGALGKGIAEKKEKLATIDLALPAAPYDLRLTCATERALTDQQYPNVASLRPGWTTKRIKRRRSYVRADKSFAWRMDVTEVTAESKNSSHPEIGYEIELELGASMTQRLIQSDDGSARKLSETLAQQLWYMLQQLNPTSDVLEVEEFLQEQTNKDATKLAIGQCGSIKRFMDSKFQAWRSAIAPTGGKSNEEVQGPRSFLGCMPVNFARHNIEEVQRSEGGYFLSEKTDGVRYLMVFTGSTCVLVDRASHESGKAYQPKHRMAGDEPMDSVVKAIKPGTVLDGEVVVHRKLRRPIFIVFDVLAISATEPILHLPFEQRLVHLRSASFVKPEIKMDVFNPQAVTNPQVALPLVRKNFVKRQDLDNLLSLVTEERGLRIYRYGETHHHLTDGIIFQPNSAYVCGTDVNLLKWKYLDTVTIDVQILPPASHRRGNGGQDDNVLNVGVMGEEGTIVNMTRYLRLPNSERLRLEADRDETGSNICEVGFDPGTGEWYYRTMRPDKVAPNHISTVLGTLLELAESLSTEELRYRMSVPPGTRDTYTKEVRTMEKQLLDHQRRRNRAASRQNN